MKKLAVLAIAFASFSVFAQRASEIKVDTFAKDRADHNIHEVKGIEILDKVEGNRVCLNNETTCEKKYLRDKITLRISGMGEANFGGHNKVALAEKSLMYDYQSGDSITELKFQGIIQNEEETLVYNNMAWAMWGGSIPFEFKIEIQNDLNKPTQSREFRIPLSRDGMFRFKVTYSNEKWSVQVLESLASKVDVQGELADKFLAAIKEDDRETAWSQESITCLKPKGIETPVCFIVGWDSSRPFNAELSKVVFEKLNAASGIFTANYGASISCQKPNQWNNQTETSCTLSLNK